MFLTFIYMKNGKTKTSGMVLKSRLSLKGTGQRTYPKSMHYMRQMAVITPYAQFLFQFISDSPEKNVLIRFTRRTDIMPSVPLETKHYPSDVDILLIKWLITETSKHTLLQFSFSTNL
ncbi:hypothetical protein AABB24_012483 [Solanum stoloniferum]|uniref:Uncharacterized protein n=1 Tax=Solanum stoloniferum TaxID=62892 RepID=A0ABD2U6N7_9SOLN